MPRRRARAAERAGSETMHLQVRTVAKQSPPNLVDFLTVLEKNGIDMLTVGGSNVEQGGEFAFGVKASEEEEEDEAKRIVGILRGAGYRTARYLEVEHCFAEDRAGGLLDCIRSKAAEIEAKGGAIKDVALGGPDSDGRILVQFYAEARMDADAG